MVIKHLSDDEVQQYAVDKSNCEKRITEHIHVCDECRSKADVYQLLITGIKQQPLAAFNFDLSASVLQLLPAQKTKNANDSLLIWLIIITGITPIHWQARILYFMQRLPNILILPIMKIFFLF